jgi:hypothetical protein
VFAGAIEVDVGPAGGLDVGPAGGLDVGPAGGLDVGPAGGLDVGPAGGLDVGVAREAPPDAVVGTTEPGVGSGAVAEPDDPPQATWVRPKARTIAARRMSVHRRADVRP